MQKLAVCLALTSSVAYAQKEQFPVLPQHEENEKEHPSILGDWLKVKVTMADYTARKFGQKLDHFNESDSRTYQQRYWYNDKYYDASAQSPVFLYLCGEWTCSPPDEQMYPMIVGAKHNALLFSLEHRYYGESQPFDDWKTENLEYLTSEQALADIANFITKWNTRFGYEADWVVVGGSYPGALSAWFKSQYPDLAVGAWSSSGVIHPIKDFKAFDLDIYTKTSASSDQCTQAITDSITYVTNQMETDVGKQRLARLFNIDTTKVDWRDFWFFYADIFVTGVQYGNRVSMCEYLENSSSTSGILMQAISELATKYGVSYEDYGAVYLQSTEIDTNSAGRQWTYQYCNEFGFYQTPNDDRPMRSETLVESFWPDYCERIFGKEMDANTDITNSHYGGLNILGDNIFFLNGSEDPWQFAAMTELRHPDTTQKTMKTAYIECDTCAHCVDFHSPVDGQPQALTDAQNAVADEVARWLSEAQENKEPKQYQFFLQ